METMLNEEVVDAVAEGTKYGCKTDNLLYVGIGLAVGIVGTLVIKPVTKIVVKGWKKFTAKKDAPDNVIEFNDGKNTK